jgi:hypothetical protein
MDQSHVKPCIDRNTKESGVTVAVLTGLPGPNHLEREGHATAVPTLSGYFVSLNLMIPQS